MRETFKVPEKGQKALSPRGRADHRAKIRFCPVCCGDLERFDASMRCTRCSNAFFILHTSSEKGLELPERSEPRNERLLHLDVSESGS